MMDGDSDDSYNYTF